MNMNSESPMSMSSESPVMQMMQMTFYTGYDATILFSGWVTETWPEMLGSCFAVLLAAILYEGLKTGRQYIKEQALKLYRSRLYQEEVQSKTPTDDASPRLTGGQLYWLHHVIQSVLHLVQVTIGFMLMLVAMTFNVWLFISIVVGAMLGYFIFNCRRPLKPDIVDDVCH